MTPREIVIAHLVAMGYDGLYDPEAGCSCDMDRLGHCGAGLDHLCCEPGYGYEDEHGRERIGSREDCDRAARERGEP